MQICIKIYAVYNHSQFISIRRHTKMSTLPTLCISRKLEYVRSLNQKHYRIVELLMVVIKLRAGDKKVINHQVLVLEFLGIFIFINFY